MKKYRKQHENKEKGQRKIVFSDCRKNKEREYAGEKYHSQHKPAEGTHGDRIKHRGECNN